MGRYLGPREKMGFLEKKISASCVHPLEGMHSVCYHSNHVSQARWGQVWDKWSPGQANMWHPFEWMVLKVRLVLQRGGVEKENQ